MSAEPELDPQQPIGPSLIAIARSMLAQAAHETRAETDALAIHGVRTQMKRWRAYLRLLEPFLDEDGARLRLEARDVARGLGRRARRAIGARCAQGPRRRICAVLGKSLATVKQRIDEVRSDAESATLKPGAREGLANAFALTLRCGRALAIQQAHLRAPRREPDRWLPARAAGDPQ